MSLLIFVHPIPIVSGNLEQMCEEKHIFCLVFISSFNLLVPGFSELIFLKKVCVYPLATLVTYK